MRSIWVRSAVSGSLALAIAFGAGTARGGEEPQLTAKAASAAYKKAVASHLKFLKAELKTQAKQFCDQANAAVIAAITSPIAPDLLLQGLANHLADTYAQVGNVINIVSGTIESDGASILSETSGHPSAFQLGDCDVIDRARDDLVKELTKFRDTLKKKLKKIMKLLGKAGYDFGFHLEPPVADGFAPNPGLVGPPVAGIVPLHVDSITSAGLAEDAADGSLALGGSADASNGTVTVTIDGPDFSYTIPDIVVLNGRWTAFSAGDMPEGNYRITVSQGGVAHTVDAGVP